MAHTVLRNKLLKQYLNHRKIKEMQKMAEQSNFGIEAYLQSWLKIEEEHR